MPLETFYQIPGGDIAWKLLVQFAEELLQLVEDAVFGLGVHFFIIFPLVDGLFEFGGHVESLE